MGMQGKGFSGEDPGEVLEVDVGGGVANIRINGRGICYGQGQGS